MVDELDPHLAAPRVEAVERVELRELELGLVRGKRFRVRFRVWLVFGILPIPKEDGLGLW